jgi:tetratricopeptide (TPR) repeat protein
VALFVSNRRALSARAEAEENLRGMSHLADHLANLVLDQYYEREPFHGVSIDETVKLLMVQSDRLRATPAINPQLLLHLSWIGDHLTHRARDAGRFAEARKLARERLEFLRECRSVDPASEDFAWEYGFALYAAGLVEYEEAKYEFALDFYDEGAALVSLMKGNHPNRARFASMLSEAYHQIEARAERQTERSIRDRARNGRKRMLMLVAPTDLKRIDQILFKACILADQGEWGQARQLVEKLVASRPPVNSQREEERQAIQQGIDDWIRREIRRWELNGDEPEGNTGDLNCQAEMLVSSWIQTCESLDPQFSNLFGSTIFLARRELWSSAMAYRKAGRWEEASRTAAKFKAIALVLAKRFPDRAFSHLWMSDYYIQESKNAWQKNDLQGVRRAYQQAIETLGRALVFNPEDFHTRKSLRVYKAKLAALPKP